jgi:putative ABC transport system permease protein
MKYLPLIWAALWRKPVESVLTWLAVTVAFALFGLMVGSNATYRRVIEAARMDRLYVNSGDGDDLPISLRQQLVRFDAVSGVGAFKWLTGYYQDPHHNAGIISVDEGMRRGWSENRSLNSAQWDELFANPQGVFVTRNAAARLQLRAGDPFPLITREGVRADGDVVWHFRVLGVVPDDPTFEGGVIIGNYRYIDNSRTAQTQGKVNGFRVAVADPARASAIALAIDRYYANSDTPTLSIPARIAAENMAHSSMDMAEKTLYIAAAGLFMVLFVTANGIAQSVRERVPEFAVLETIGFGHRAIVAMVFAEAAAQCLPGAALGMALATTLSRWPLRYLPSDLGNLPLPTLSAIVYSWAALFAVLLALASSAVPVFRLRALSVTDALAGR